MMNGHIKHWLIAGLVTIALAVPVIYVFALSHAEGPSQQHHVFTGCDKRGDFQAALRDAQAKALEAAGCCDYLVTYEVREIKGQVGGFAGVNEIEVLITASW